MAEFVNPLGKIRGKFGNVITYGGPNGKNYCRGTSISRKPSQEPQKRQSAAFGTITERKIWMRNAVQLGFPGGNGYPKGFQGIYQRERNGCGDRGESKSGKTFQ